MGTLWAVSLWDQLENHYCTPGVPVLRWGPQCSWTAFIKLDKSSQQNEIVAFSEHCILTLGLPDLWAENRNKHVGTLLDTSGHWCSTFIHFIASLVYQISNEDNKACGAGSLWDLIYNFHLATSNIVTSKLDLVRLVQGQECVEYQLQDQCITLSQPTIYIGYPGSKNARISHLSQYSAPTLPRTGESCGQTRLFNTFQTSHQSRLNWHWNLDPAQAF